MAAASGPGAGRPVLYVHGATFPSALSVGFRFGGRAWLEALAAAGFDAWGFDFAGFGGSGQYAAMAEPAGGRTPLGRTDEAAHQVLRAIRFIAARHGGRPVSLIAHSWGSMPTGHVAGRYPDLIDRLVLFGPIAQRRMPGLPQPESIGAWRLVTAEEQYRRFIEDVPAGQPAVLDGADFAAWAEIWLDTDAESRRRQPPAVRIPAGPAADILAAWQGALPWDPALVRAPVLIVRGAWDSLTTDADSGWLRAALAAAADIEDAVIPQATHLMHLESGRTGLYRATERFLLEAGQA
jgi:pimeloyl-ACP methyl ester carboxylesterase